MNDPTISRRAAGLMALGAAGAGALSLGPAPAIAAKKVRDELPTDPKEILESVGRIYGTSGKDRVTWKTKIIVYGVQA
jgi:hypothetical protein